MTGLLCFLLYWLYVLWYIFYLNSERVFEVFQKLILLYLAS